MSWESALRPALRHARTWERTSSLDVLNWCSPKIVSLYRYWNDCRGVRLMPRRADIDPVEMRSWLPRITLIDVEERGARFRYRVVGTDIVALRGFDPTGRGVDAAWPAEDADRVLGAYAEVVARKSAVFCHPSERRHVGHEPVVGIMLLPLSNDGENVDQVLGYVGDKLDLFDPVI